MCEIWVSAASELDRRDWCGQCGRRDSQGQAQTAFQRKRKEEERIRKGRSKVKLFCGTVVNHGFWRKKGGGHSHELAQEVKSSQMDKCVSASQGCVFG